MSETNQQDLLIPTPDQVEKVMIEKELKAQQAQQDPLDTHATLFYLFNPRFQNTLDFLSEKQLIKLVQTLAGSKHNKQEDLNKIAKVGNILNLKGLIRVIKAAVEFPLESKTLNSITRKSELKFFELFNGLLTNKYFSDIKEAGERLTADPELKITVEEMVFHTFNKKEFDKRSMPEKDAFAIGNKLLTSKFLMMHVTEQEELARIQKEQIEKNEKDKLDSKPQEVVNESNKQ
jgi:hypothetical protein